MCIAPDVDFLNFLLNLCNKYNPTNSHAPSYEPIVTSKRLPFFFVQVLSSPNSTDFLQCIMRLIVSSSILTYSFAKLIDFFSKFSVIDG